MRLTLAVALDVLYYNGVDIYDVEQLKQLDASTLADTCKRLNVTPAMFPELLQRAFYGNDTTPQNGNDNKSNKHGNAQKVDLKMLIELAGEAGATSFDLTPFELLHMLIGARRRQWSTTSAVLAMINNVNCQKKSQLKTPADFNPMIKSETETKTQSFDDLFRKL